MGVRNKTREKMGLGELRAYDEVKGKYLDKENPQIDYTPERYDPSVSDKDELAVVGADDLESETARLRSRETRREGIANRLGLGAALDSLGDTEKKDLPPTHFATDIGTETDLHGAQWENPERGTSGLKLPSSRSRGQGRMGNNHDWAQNVATAAHEIEHAKGKDHTAGFGLMQGPANERDLFIAKKFIELRQRGVPTPEATKIITAAIRDVDGDETVPSYERKRLAERAIESAAQKVTNARGADRGITKPSS